MAILITTDDEVIHIEPRNGSRFTLKELQNAVGGHIEIVTIEPHVAHLSLVINPAARQNGQLPNLLASTAHGRGTITGNALLCSTAEIHGEASTLN